MSVLSHPRFHDEVAAFAWLEGQLWANGTVCPALRCCRRSRVRSVGRARSQEREEPRWRDPPRPEEVWRVPQAVHRQGRHRVRACPHAAAPDATGGSPDRVEQEGHQLAPALAPVGDQLQGRLVLVASHPRSHGRSHHADHGRPWRDHRGRRDLHRHEEGCGASRGVASVPRCVLSALSSARRVVSVRSTRTRWLPTKFPISSAPTSIARRT